MDDIPFQERRILPPDYPQQARERIKKFFGWSDAEFEAEMRKLRRPIDHPSRTPSKRALLETIRQACQEKGIPFWPGDRDHTWLTCSCGRLSIAGEDGDDSCLCGRPAGELREATLAEIDAVPAGVTISVVRWSRSE